MKKQIITVISVFVAAVLLFTAYMLIFKKNDIEEVGDDFYKLSDSASEKLSLITETTVFTLIGYDEDDEGFYMINKFTESIVAANKHIKRDEGSGEKCVTVRSDASDKTETIPYDDFFKCLYDGTRYAFDGENLLVNAALTVNGIENIELPLRALTGYDTDGDIISSGSLYMFESMPKSQISILSMKNPVDEFSVIQQDGSFYFSDSYFATYDDEAFAIFTTNCRLAIANGKMALPENRQWSDYGLDTKNYTTACYSILTLPDSEGYYYLHTVYIGNLSATGNYYYARYVGGLLREKEAADETEEASSAEEPSEESGEEAAPESSVYESDTSSEIEEASASEDENTLTGNSEVVYSLSKDIIYFIDTTTVQDNLCVAAVDLMNPTIVNAIGTTEGLIKIDNISIDYKDGVSALIKNFSAFNATSNLAASDNSALSSVISDKASASDYSAYSGGWKNYTDVFAGFTSSDGKSTGIDAALAKYAKNGKYSVTFGLVRDDSAGAGLPENIRILYSTDRVNWTAPENCDITPSQSDKTIKKYTLEFECSNENIRYMRIAFDVPQIKDTYVVFDEIRIYADGEDAQPTDSVSGLWRLVLPTDYIPEGRNFAYLDMTNFNSFVQELAALEGDRVVACGISNGGDPRLMDNEKLAKYGLDDPAKHISYEYEGITTHLYVSEKQESGVYYAYSAFIGEYQGNDVAFTTDVIVEISTETAPWLDWEFFEFTDHSLLSMYIVEISEATVSFDGTDYKFLLSLNESGDLGSVSYNGKSMDVKSFKYLYQAILSVYMQDEYVPSEDEVPEEYLRIKIISETRSPEIIFYRVSSSKCYFTIDGEGGYYALATEVNNVKNKVLAYVNGEIFTSSK